MSHGAAPRLKGFSPNESSARTTTCGAPVDGAHKLDCKAQQIDKQRAINRSHAVGKSFESILVRNRMRANEIRPAAQVNQ